MNLTEFLYCIQEAGITTLIFAIVLIVADNFYNFFIKGR